ncbi:hypothetical protein AU10_22860 [Escherichia coli E1728]|nr:hypothetical protein AU10_22860 [Escherichia coli E1728]KEP80499.1 hypothetical protein AU08_0223845 [Escherichia coli E1140]
MIYAVKYFVACSFRFNALPIPISKQPLFILLSTEPSTKERLMKENPPFHNGKVDSIFLLIQTYPFAQMVRVEPKCQHDFSGIELVYLTPC